MTLLGTANPDGTGNYALIDIPGYEPVFVNLDLPLEAQLQGPILEAARKILSE